ncbi:hypothetical protein D6C77_01550 [Aureobasidium pullulans]|uniref:BTB domain-containing protein n=1 Tax=Aureobasidium pullulans TaxID=5580 RepID=A0A4T0DSA6_AURPU|nr:hypothetical protein D6D12_06629 [Aureobasidium pullulans]THZ12909.1 hypothetical protein D6C90_10339 [Aureobasidium pullulans]TIA64289.1 hypothetical protein D6C77_01550 [Aureobasidium pullulans]
MASAEDFTARFYDDGTKWSDIIIKYGDYQIHAHKAILAQQSGYFLRAFSSSLPVSSSPIIDLGDDDDPELLEWILQYLYCHGTAYAYFLDSKNSATPISMEQLVNLYELADKYDIVWLRNRIDLAFCKSGSLDLLEDSGQHSAFVDCIAKVCGPHSHQAADRALQRTVMRLCQQNCQTLFRDQKFLKLYSEGKLFDAEQATKLGMFLGKQLFATDDTDSLYDGESETLSIRSFVANAREKFSLFNNVRFSDLTITLGDGQKIFSHKVILASDSTYFQDMFERFPSMDNIDLSAEENSAAAIAYVKDFYTGDGSSDAECSMSCYADMHMLAKKHGREDFAAYYQERFYDILTEEDPFDDKYIANLTKYRGPHNFKYSESSLPEMVFEQVLNRVQFSQWRCEYPPESFGTGLGEGTIFNAKFAGRFAKEMFSSFVEELQLNHG